MASNSKSCERISKSILMKAKEKAENLDWLTIPPEERFIDDSILSWIANYDDSGFLSAEDSDVNQPDYEDYDFKDDFDFDYDLLDYDFENAGQNDAKRAKLETTTVSRKKLLPLTDASNRFETVDLTSEDQLSTFSKGFVPTNTKANTGWAVRNFTVWADWRRIAKPDDPVPTNILSCGNAATLNKWLSLYVIEARKKDGTRFPTSSLNLLLCGLKRHMKQLNSETPNFLDEKDDRFAGLRGTRDVIARNLREDGVGATVKHTSTVSLSKETKLWSEGVIDVCNPNSLLNAVFYMTGKVMCLRGGREHRSLKLSQFTFGKDQEGDYVVYAENGSKNRSGSYKEKADSNKIVKHYADPSLMNKCYYYVLKFYYSKLPSKVVNDSTSGFYWKPKDKVPSDDDAPWFIPQPIGRNMLASMVKKMFERVGITGKTNHSLRAIGATRLFEANVPEKLIQERTGHRSLDSLRKYERTSVVQQKAVSSVISTSKPTPYMSAAVSVEHSETAEESKVFSMPPGPMDSAGTGQSSGFSGMSLFQNCNNCTINVCFNQQPN